MVVSSTLTISEGGKPRADVAGGEIDWQGEMNRVGGVPAGPDLVLHRHRRQYRSGADPHGRSLARPALQIHREQQHPGPARQRAVLGPAVAASGVSASTSTRPASTSPSAGRSAARKIWRSGWSTASRSITCCPATAARYRAAFEFDQRPPVGTQFWWGGLIHEGVAVANDQVDRIEVLVGRAVSDASSSLAVVVVSYNTLRPAARLPAGDLRLSGPQPRPWATVWVVDNASTDGSAADGGSGVSTGRA